MLTVLLYHTCMTGFHLPTAALRRKKGIPIGQRPSDRVCIQRSFSFHFIFSASVLLTSFPHVCSFVTKCPTSCKLNQPKWKKNKVSIHLKYCHIQQRVRLVLGHGERQREEDTYCRSAPPFDSLFGGVSTAHFF